MKISTNQLIDELVTISKDCLSKVIKLNELPLKDLQTRQSVDAWSALECIAHLNRYAAFYLPEIESALNKSTAWPSPYFKAGVLGNYFAKSMQVKPQVNKMKTFKAMNPLNSTLTKEVLLEFIEQQKFLLSLLEVARNYNLMALKTPISISKFIKLRLGDTLRVLIYHNERHLAQAIAAVH